MTPGEVIDRGRKAKLLLADPTITAHFEKIEKDALSRLIEAVSEQGRTEILSEAKAYRGIRRALEQAVVAGEQMAKKEDRNGR